MRDLLTDSLLAWGTLTDRWPVSKGINPVRSAGSEV